ncbi:hypothetical protein HKCCE2091_09270 [Rhodobacterales bacterium HKCCE2091]|nr:hypothetical protein [Rhodobacterales bacterium HKCCE2091]
MSIHSDLNFQTDGPVLDPASVNGDLCPARSAINAALIGLPSGYFGGQSTPPQSLGFAKMLETADLGPFTATGLAPAIRALRAIVTDISLETPDLYDRIGCTEMLGCRKVRGSHSVISNHSWGIAIDLTIDGLAETDGSDEVMDALLRLWPIFNRHGFYWGYAFGLADALHFEASDQLVRSWAEAGAFGGGATDVVLPRALSIGDRGPEVLRLQQALNQVLKPLAVTEDGMFGPDTRMAVFAVQKQAGLPPTGAAPKPVLAALGLI